MPIWDSAKQKIHTVVRKSGWYLKRRRNLPPGVDWMLDVQRMVGVANVTTIIDVGANIGQTALPLAEAFPGADIHCFEPIPATFAVLQQNTRHVPAIRCHPWAMGAQDGQAEIMAVPLAWTNSLVSRRLDDDPEAQPVSVNISTVDEFCARQGIADLSMLKTDTEGYDVEVLAGARKLLAAAKIAVIYIEVTCQREKTRLHSFFPEVLDALAGTPMRFIGLYETDSLFQGGDHDLYANALFVDENRIGT